MNNDKKCLVDGATNKRPLPIAFGMRSLPIKAMTRSTSLS